MSNSDLEVRVTLEVYGETIDTFSSVLFHSKFFSTRILFSRQAPLGVQLTPQIATVDVGRSATFRCLVSGGPVNAIWWFKDGTNISDSSTRYVR